jgi:hypothetical protein
MRIATSRSRPSSANVPTAVDVRKRKSFTCGPVSAKRAPYESDEIAAMSSAHATSRRRWCVRR